MIFNARKICCTLALCGLSLSPATAATQQAQTTASICFEGRSTLHDFEGTVKEKHFQAAFRDDPKTGQMWISAESAFSVLDMTTDNKKRDKKMFKMLDQPTFSTISGSLVDAELPLTGTTTAPVRLTICGIEQEIVATLSDWNSEDNLVTFNISAAVSLKAFNLKAPSVIGLIRVDDTVQINCSLLARLNTESEEK